MKNITLQTLRDWDACSNGYDKIAKHVGENEVIDLDLALQVIPIPDVVWVLSHDPDKHRWLSFLVDMIDLPGCEAKVQAVRDYRGGRGTSGIDVTCKTFEDLRKIAADSDAAIATHAAIAANGGISAISIGGKPRLIKLIRRYYQ